MAETLQTGTVLSRTGMELRKPEWRQLSEELFLSEYENPKEFYKKFSEPTDLYMELASCVVAASVVVDVRTANDGVSLRDPLYLAAKRHQQQLLDAAACDVMYTAFCDDAVNNNKKQLYSLIDQYKAVNREQ